eukprot:TRINITY_DN67817_c4_g4_i1.p1 TRINITY_DN67817_c4_g4~~TRINITY_DN67817_c4_g4_i1.p1  ORF type:complete len:894 (-),score=125.18 TRINITY_DN67817_c4_g4_i1:2624-5194(-)
MTVSHTFTDCVTCSDLSTGIGSPLYSAPEQLSATTTSGSYGPAADIYSLGIIFFECYIRTQTEAERIDLLRKLRERSEVPLEMLQKWPEEMKLIKRMVEKDPARRPTLSEIEESSRRQMSLIKQQRQQQKRKATTSTSTTTHHSSSHRHHSSSPSHHNHIMNSPTSVTTPTTTTTLATLTPPSHHHHHHHHQRSSSSSSCSQLLLSNIQLAPQGSSSSSSSPNTGQTQTSVNDLNISNLSTSCNSLTLPLPLGPSSHSLTSSLSGDCDGDGDSCPSSSTNKDTINTFSSSLVDQNQAIDTDRTQKDSARYVGIVGSSSSSTLSHASSYSSLDNDNVTDDYESSSSNTNNNNNQIRSDKLHLLPLSRDHPINGCGGVAQSTLPNTPATPSTTVSSISVSSYSPVFDQQIPLSVHTTSTSSASSQLQLHQHTHNYDLNNNEDLSLRSNSSTTTCSSSGQATTLSHATSDNNNNNTNKDKEKPNIGTTGMSSLTASLAYRTNPPAHINTNMGNLKLVVPPKRTKSPVTDGVVMRSKDMRLDKPAQKSQAVTPEHHNDTTTEDEMTDNADSFVSSPCSTPLSAASTLCADGFGLSTPTSLPRAPHLNNLYNNSNTVVHCQPPHHPPSLQLQLQQQDTTNQQTDGTPITVIHHPAQQQTQMNDTVECNVRPSSPTSGATASTESAGSLSGRTSPPQVLSHSASDGFGIGPRMMSVPVTTTTSTREPFTITAPIAIPQPQQSHNSVSGSFDSHELLFGSAPTNPMTPPLCFRDTTTSPPPPQFSLLPPSAATVGSGASASPGLLPIGGGRMLHGGVGGLNRVQAHQLANHKHSLSTRFHRRHNSDPCLSIGNKWLMELEGNE